MDRIENIWDVSKNTFKIQQIKEEWLWLLSHVNPNSDILEIGCYDGGTTYSLAHFAKSLVTIDLHSPARFDKNQIKQICSKYAYIGGDSHISETHNRLNGYDFDFMLIDGDHTYEGAKIDFDIYSKYIRKGGQIAFHDIIASESHAQQNCFVSKLWAELKEKYPSEEFILDPNGAWGGIGIIKYG